MSLHYRVKYKSGMFSYDFVANLSPSVSVNEWWGTGIVICLERGADLHMAQLMPLPLIVSCFGKIQIGFIFLVPAHPGSPGKRAVKRVCVCVCVCVSVKELWKSVNIWGSHGQEFSVLFFDWRCMCVVTSRPGTAHRVVSLAWGHEYFIDEVLATVRCALLRSVYSTWTELIRYDTRCHFNVRSKADISQLNLPHGTDN